MQQLRADGACVLLAFLLVFAFVRVRVRFGVRLRAWGGVGFLGAWGGSRFFHPWGIV